MYESLGAIRLSFTVFNDGRRILLLFSFFKRSNSIYDTNISNWIDNRVGGIAIAIHLYPKFYD